MTNHRCAICGMPLVEGGHNCPALTAMPSREFLIRQACLNWANEIAPISAARFGAAYVLGTVSVGGTILARTPDIVAGIRRHHRALTSKHTQQDQACRS